MKLLEKAKNIVKDTKKKEVVRRSPMDELLSDPEVKKAARYLAKHLGMSKARDVLNQLLEDEGRLPVAKNGKVRTITYQRFKTLMPTPRRKRSGEQEEN